MLENLTDDALINRYVQNNDRHAFDVLTLRHRDPVYWQFYKSCPGDAEDLVQELLEKLLIKLHVYQAQGKFPAYLSTIVRHMLIDHWKAKNQKIRRKSDSQPDDKRILSIPSEHLPEKAAEVYEQQEHIFYNLIPKLPCKQRMAFLLMQESTFWEGAQKLSWHDLAALNGIDTNEAVSRFIRTRDALLLQNDEVSCEDVLIFFVWTQCQRIDKKHKFTMSYFANLLHIKTDTFKTREREAKKKLRFWVKRWNTL